jgi:hypothetical protein
LVASYILSLTSTHGRAPLDDWSDRREDLSLPKTAQHRKTRTNIHTLGEI